MLSHLMTIKTVTATLEEVISAANAQIADNGQVAKLPVGVNKMLDVGLNHVVRCAGIANKRTYEWDMELAVMEGLLETITNSAMNYGMTAEEIVKYIRLVQWAGKLAGIILYGVEENITLLGMTIDTAIEFLLKQQ